MLIAVKSSSGSIGDVIWADYLCARLVTKGKAESLNEVQSRVKALKEGERRLDER